MSSHNGKSMRFGQEIVVEYWFIYNFSGIQSNDKLLSFSLICKSIVEKLNEITCVQYLT